MSQIWCDRYIFGFFLMLNILRTNLDHCHCEFACFRIIHWPNVVLRVFCKQTILREHFLTVLLFKRNYFSYMQHNISIFFYFLVSRHVILTGHIWFSYHWNALKYWKWPLKMYLVIWNKEGIDLVVLNLYGECWSHIRKMPKSFTENAEIER